MDITAFKGSKKNLNVTQCFWWKTFEGIDCSNFIILLS